MEWIVVIALVLVLAWLVLGPLRRRGDVGHSRSREEESRLREEASRDEALREAQGFAQEWEALIEQHPGARAAYERVLPHGEEAVEALSRHHREHRDPEQLPEAAERIARGFEASRDGDEPTE